MDITIMANIARYRPCIIDTEKLNYGCLDTYLTGTRRQQSASSH